MGELGEVKTGKQQILVDETDARLVGKLQAFAGEWEETFGWRMVAFVVETREGSVVQWEAFVHGQQVVLAVRKVTFV